MPTRSDFLRPAHRGAAVLCCLALGAWAPGALADAEQDQAVREAHAAWRERNAARLDAAAASLQSHVLAPYVQYWQVMLAPEDRRLQRFIDQHRGSYLAERLREDWVRGLGRRSDWALLARVAAEVELPDGDVACWVLRARQVRGDRSAGDELLAGPWRQWRELPEGCMAAARELAQAGRIGTAAIWSRARNLAGLGNVAAARRTLALLPAAQSPTPRQLDLALSTPERWLDSAVLDIRTAAERELLAMALGRVASTDPLRATKALHQHRGRLEAPQLAYVHAQLGLYSARRLQDDAPAWFSMSQAGDLTDEHRAWWVRAALRTQRWGEVRTAIAGMSEGSREEPRWQYWLARASQALGDTRRARALWRTAAREHGFYGRLAQESLGTEADSSPAPRPARQEIDAIARDLAVQRALALQRTGLRDDARGEWNWAMRRLGDRALVAASRYAQQLGLWNRVLDSAQRTSAQHDLSARYPTPYLALVRPAAQQFGVDEALMYGVMQHESRFSVEATSTAGARGLMQLMPQTAQWLAGELGWRDYQVDWLDEPKRNITLGARYLRQLSKDLGGSPVLAVAAYNAGPGRATQWRAARALEGAVYAESIPFEETREYVKRVMAAQLHYRERLGRDPQRLSSLLGVVPGGAAAAQSAIAATSGAGVAARAAAGRSGMGTLRAAPGTR